MCGGGCGAVGLLNGAVIYVPDPSIVATDRNLGLGDVPDVLHALVLIGLDDLHQSVDAAELLAAIEGIKGWRRDTVHHREIIDGGASVEGAQGASDSSFVGVGRLASLGAEVGGDEREGEDRGGDPALVHEVVL